MSTTCKEIVITYEGNGVKIERYTPKGDRPLLIYESAKNPRIPDYIASLWFNHGVFKVVDLTDED